MSGTLYVCATPIGNLEDITIRTINVLKSVDFIAAEDTRRTLGLLNHYEISKPLVSYHEHNKNTRGPEIIERLREGQSAAVVSDAGMPGISDPGEDIVKLAIEEGIRVEVLPGPSAFVTALVASGLPAGRFMFFGFLGRDKKERRKQLESISREKCTIIFYEAPHRLLGMLESCLEVLGNRKVSVAREITKLYEETIRGDIQHCIDHFKNSKPRGEFVVVIEGSSYDAEYESEHEMEGLTSRECVISFMEKEGLSKKDAIKKTAKLKKVHKNEVYKETLDI